MALNVTAFSIMNEENLKWHYKLELLVYQT